MKLEATIEKVELNPLGEIRIGCNSYGVLIKTNFGDFDVFKDMPVLVGNADLPKCIEQSSCKRYLLLKGAFGTYILDIKDQAISVYKSTIHGSNNELSEEHAIFGNEKTHIKGFSRNYYLQFPFVRQKSFKEILDKYEALRKAQIEAAVNAL